MKKRNKHIGSTLDDFLRKEGILKEARTTAENDAQAWRLQGLKRFEAAYAPEDSVYEQLADDVPDA